MFFLQVLYEYDPKSKILQQIIIDEELLFDIGNKDFIDMLITTENEFYQDRKDMLDAYYSLLKKMKEEGLKSQYYITLLKTGEGYNNISREILNLFWVFFKITKKHESNLNTLKKFKRFYFNIKSYHNVLGFARGNRFSDLVDMQIYKNEKVIKFLEEE